MRIVARCEVARFRSGWGVRSASKFPTPVGDDHRARHRVFALTPEQVSELPTGRLATLASKDRCFPVRSVVQASHSPRTAFDCYSLKVD